MNWQKKDLDKEIKALEKLQECKASFKELEAIAEINKIVSNLEDKRLSINAQRERLNSMEEDLRKDVNRFNELSDFLGRTTNFGVLLGRIELI